MPETKAGCTLFKLMSHNYALGKSLIFLKINPITDIATLGKPEREHTGLPEHGK